MRYYAIADLHGRLDLLEKAFKLIKTDANIAHYKIVTLGDYIDRGPASKGVLDYLKYRVGHDTSDNELICLQGNHEAMMVETLTKPLMPDWWVGNGGDATLKSYGWGGEPYSIYSYDVVPKAHVEWMQGLPLYFETEKQLFVHAGIPQDNMNLPPNSKQAHQEKRLKEQMIWMLYDRNTAGGWKGKHVVHGHHQFADGPHVWHGPKGGRTDLDTFAWNTGRLVVGVFDDTQGSAIKYIEVLGEDYKRPT